MSNCIGFNSNNWNFFLEKGEKSMGLSEKKMLLVDALLSQKGLQELLNIASRIMGNPMFVTDRSNHAIAVSDTKYVEDIGWNMMKISVPDQGLGVRDACLEEIVSSGALEATFRSEHPYIQQFSFSTFRYVSCRIILQTLVIGQLVMIECFNAYTDEEEELLMFVARILSEEMRHYGNPRMQAVPYYGIITELLERNHKISENQLISRTATLGIKFPLVSRLILIQPVLSEMEMQLFYLRNLFLQRFPDSLAITKDAYIVMIVDNRQDIGTICRKLEFEIKRYRVQAGVSSLCYSPLNLSTSFLQAQAAINTGRKFSPDDRIYCYADWATLHMVDCACQNCPPETFYSPKFQRLLTYDEVNHTSYTEDLMKYLAKGKNIMQTAECLHIHKNSMYYRLAKIEEICECSLKDYQTTFEMQMAIYFYRERLLLNGDKQG